MKRIYTSSNFVQVGQLEGILADHGIAVLVKNQHLMGAIGELPEFECWPELWVTRDADAERALALVEDCLSAPSPDARSWRCPRCAETLEPPFDSCWNCGTERPEEHQGTL